MRDLRFIRRFFRLKVISLIILVSASALCARSFFIADSWGIESRDPNDICRFVLIRSGRGGLSLAWGATSRDNVGAVHLHYYHSAAEPFYPVMHRGGSARVHEIGGMGFQWGDAAWYKRSSNAYAHNLTFPLWFVILSFVIIFLVSPRAKKNDPKNCGFDVIAGL